MLKKRIIALAGPKTCGKDTLMEGIKKRNPYNHVHLNFAWPMKEMLRLAFGWSHEDMADAQFKETVTMEFPFIEPRWPMMDVANWFRDKYGPDVWVNALERRINSLMQEEMARGRVGRLNILITDLRFPNELDWLLEQKAFIGYVQRDEAEERLHKAKLNGDAKALNPSEAHYEEIRRGATAVIENNDTMIVTGKHSQ